MLGNQAVVKYNDILQFWYEQEKVPIAMLGPKIKGSNQKCNKSLESQSLLLQPYILSLWVSLKIKCTEER